ncbi:MAG TPA: response regulator [Planctomycetota bacterium]|nr:response regulator [Planctomycetota bacterium]
MIRPVLAAEDEESDAVILARVFLRAQVPNPLIVVRDGQDAIDYLGGVGAYADRSAHPLPALLLLDLKMPRVSGFEVLTWLSSRPELKELPAVVLSSSTHQSDIDRALQLGARGYHIKPQALDRFVELAKGLRSRWLQPR